MVIAAAALGTYQSTTKISSGGNGSKSGGNAAVLRAVVRVVSAEELSVPYDI